MANRLPKIKGNIAKLGKDPEVELQYAVELLKKHRDSRPRHAVLDEDGNPIPAELMEWARWMEQSRQRYTMFTEIEDHHVSTVFLGLDMNLSLAPNAKPLWFETMVFGLPKETDLFGKPMMVRPSLWETRTTTKEQAIAAHEEGIVWLKNYLVRK